MEIKFFAFLSLIPCSYVLLKFKRRVDISCIDIIILMHAIYLCVIPIIGDPAKILYPSVQNDVTLQFQTSVITMLFFLTMIFFDLLLKKKMKNKVCLFNISLFIREWLTKIALSSKVYVLILLLLVVLAFIALKSFGYSALLGSGTIEDMRQASKSINTPFMMWLLFGSHILRLLMVFLLVAIFVKRKVVNASVWTKMLFCIVSIAFFVYHFLISRTYFIESLLMLGLLLYSYYKDYIKIRHFAATMLLFVFAFVIVLPIISGVKMAKRSMIIAGRQSMSLSELVEVSMSSVMGKNESNRTYDNKSSRSWYVYQIMGLALNGNYWGHGVLTREALSYGIPKVVYPDKSVEGSQGAIEIITGARNDVADSVLLLCILENRCVSFFLASCYFLMAVFLYDKLYKLMNYIQMKTTLLAPVFVSSLFIFLNRVEFSLDNFIPSIEKMILWYVVIVFVMKIIREKTLIKKEI